MLMVENAGRQLAGYSLGLRVSHQSVRRSAVPRWLRAQPVGRRRAGRLFQLPSRPARLSRC
jgi:hypothetical protein